MRRAAVMYCSCVLKVYTPVEVHSSSGLYYAIQAYSRSRVLYINAPDFDSSAREVHLGVTGLVQCAQRWVLECRARPSGACRPALLSHVAAWDGGGDANGGVRRQVEPVVNVGSSHSPYVAPPPPMDSRSFAACMNLVSGGVRRVAGVGVTHWSQADMGSAVLRTRAGGDGQARAGAHWSASRVHLKVTNSGTASGSAALDAHRKLSPVP